MTFSPLQEGVYFLIKSLFDLYLLVLIIRFLLAFAKANYFNPVTQVTVKLTNALVKPVRRVIPNFRNVECASLLLVVGLNALKYSLLMLLNNASFNVIGLFILTTADTLRLLVQVMTGALFIYVLLSWIQPFSEIQSMLRKIVAPLVQPFQRLIPPVAGFDLSIIPAFLLLQVTLIVLVNPLLDWGMTMTFLSAAP